MTYARFKDEAMKKRMLSVSVCCLLAGCSTISNGVSFVGGLLGCSKPYGDETQMFLPGEHRQVWAIAPAVNISGQDQVDALLQSDLVYQELQKVHGLTVIPVDRVVEVYASLKIDKIESEKQATEICKLLGCDGLVVPTVTAYDPYDPPKFGASLQLFVKPGTFQRMPRVDPRALERSPTPIALPVIEQPTDMAQVVEIYDASDGTIRDKVDKYAKGRTDPNGPLGVDEITVSMDRFCAFGYHDLLGELLDDLKDANAGQG
jgi:hypothetical protein